MSQLNETEWEIIVRKRKSDLDFTESEAKKGNPLAIQFLEDYQDKLRIAQTELNIARLREETNKKMIKDYYDNNRSCSMM